MFAGRVGVEELVRRQEFHVGDALPGVCGEGVQDAGEPVRDPAYGVGVEPLGVVLEPQVESSAGLDDQGERIVDGVVELVTRQPKGARRVGEVGRGRVVLEDDERVEEFARAREAG